MSGGRPTIYSQELAEKICARISEGEPLKSLCAENGMPNRDTVYAWVRSNEEFSGMYARAKELQLDRMAEDLLEISDDGTNDTYTTTDGNGNEREVVNHDHINRSRLRVDTRKWLLSKLAPKKYGDKAIVQHEGGETPIQHAVICPAASELLAKIIGKPAAELNSMSTQEIE